MVDGGYSSGVARPVSTRWAGHRISNVLSFSVRPGTFRFFLALLVFAHHSSSFGLGSYAVYVFFVLSGFWVERMWRGRYSRARQPYLTYLVSRVWRLSPVFVLVGTITIVLEYLIRTPLSVLLSSNCFHLVFSSIFILGYGYLSFLPLVPAWSLDIEVQYYVFAPLLSVVGSWIGAAALLAVFSLVSLTVALSGGQAILPGYLFFFVAGLAAAAATWRPSARLATVSACAAVAIVVLVALSRWRGIVFGGAHPGPLFVWNPALNIVAAVVTIPFAIYTTSQPSGTRDRMFADLSYVVYLQHWIAIVWLSWIGGSALHRMPYAAFAWIVVLATSYVIWRYFDHPINRARAEWVASRIRAVPAAVAREVPGP